MFKNAYLIIEKTELNKYKLYWKYENESEIIK